ncbi:glycosyltransferase family 9 protein [Candidatus Poribacteria bacterium]|nr:glycosyltransferase family 9 protein [Candidatus Poribacteria bacterium]
MGERLLFLVSWLLWRIAFAHRRLPEHPRAILVVKLDHLGDAILATPVLTNLRRHFPDARIDLLCARWNRPAFAVNPNVNRILELNPRTFRRSGPRDRFGRVRQALLALRGSHDIVITLRGTGSCLLLAKGFWLDRGAVRVDAALRRRPKPIHEADIMLSLLESAGITVRTREPQFFIPDDTEPASEALARFGVPTDLPIVAMHVGSPVPEKRWVPRRYAGLANRLIQDGMRVLLLGTAAEEAMSAEVLRDITGSAHDLTGKTSLALTARLLSSCAAFVGNDSAPMHLAAALGTPTLGLFFASDPTRFGPRGSCARFLSASDPRALTVDDVYRAVREMLGQTTIRSGAE